MKELKLTNEICLFICVKFYFSIVKYKLDELIHIFILKSFKVFSSTLQINLHEISKYIMIILVFKFINIIN